VRSQEKSCDIRSRVIKAREIQAKRYKDHPGIYCNAQMTSKLLKEICLINTVGQNLLKTAMEKLNLSARAYDRILKVSRTIADLSQSEESNRNFWPKLSNIEISTGKAGQDRSRSIFLIPIFQ
jgi:magnesium chelatase family protein